MAMGNRAKLAGLNIIGMKRGGIERSSIHALRAAYKAVFHSGKPVQEAAGALAGEENDHLVDDMLTFIRDARDRAICTPV